MILCYISLLPTLFCISGYGYPEKHFVYNNYKLLSNNDSNYILPTNLKPSLYQLTIAPYFNNNSFSGLVVITCDVLNATDVIVLNLNNDSITTLSHVSVFDARETVDVTIVTFDSTHEFVKIQLNTSLSVQNDVKIKIIFSGRLGNDMLGFYLSTYSSPSVNQ